MTPQSVELIPLPGHVLTRRDLVRPVFRHRRAALASFLTLAALVAIVAFAWPDRYKAEMKILVKRDRVEPVNGVAGQGDGVVTDSDINSEVALLQSRDLLEQVVLGAGLVPGAPAQRADQRMVAKKAAALATSLDVSAVRKSAIIEVAYTAPDPQTAAHVLSTLGELYLEKHLEVFGSPGAYQFFTQQADRLGDELRSAQGRLVAFGKEAGVVSAASEKAATIQKLGEFEAGLEQVRAQIADSNQRLVALREEMAATPERQVTQQRTEENPALMSQLTSRVLDLELRRTEMLRKFAPTYPPAVELEQQLGQARAALARAQQSPMKNEATDQNPTHQWLSNELVRVQAERQALDARARAIATTIREYEVRARVLDEQDANQQELLRAVKSAEDSYLLYRRKAEEARISEALDRRRIANVTIAENPGVPPSSSGHRALLLLAGLVIALCLALAVAFLLEYLNPRFRTRAEVERVLELPVLATLPASLTR